MNLRDNLLATSRPILAGGLILLTVCSVNAARANPAQSRAAAYQVEMRAVLEKHHWQVAKDQPGRLVATSPLGPGGASFGSAMPDTPMMAYLTITFQAQTSDHTGCAASIVAYIYNKSPSDVQRHWSKPIPFANAESKKQIQDMVAEAQNHLTKDHPEYAKK